MLRVRIRMEFVWFSSAVTRILRCAKFLTGFENRYSANERGFLRVCRSGCVHREVKPSCESGCRGPRSIEYPCPDLTDPCVRMPFSRTSRTQKIFFKWFPICFMKEIPLALQQFVEATGTTRPRVTLPELIPKYLLLSNFL